MKINDKMCLSRDVTMHATLAQNKSEGSEQRTVGTNGKNIFPIRDGNFWQFLQQALLVWLLLDSVAS